MNKFLLALLLFVLHCAVHAQTLVPGMLRTEYLENPLAIETPAPRFSWSYDGKLKNKFQEAYEIIVSEQRGAVEDNRGTTWSSGKVISSQQSHISYAGSKLRSHTRYYWRVKTYTVGATGGEWSAVSSFETAFLPGTSWEAKWIDDGQPLRAKDEDYYKPDPMPLFRKDFSLKKKVRSARLYISGLGYYEAYINGKRVSENVLDPGWTAYGKQVFYVAHDVTAMVKKGENIAGVMLGNGWWHPLPIRLFGRWELRNYQQTGRPCLRAEMHIQYVDGTTDKIISDDTWTTASGPVIKNNVYLGEHYDARRERNDWLRSSKNAGWRQASVTKGPAGEMTVQMQPPVQVTKELKPISIRETGKDTFIVDMGRNFAGVARIRVKGKKGDKITMRFGEGLFPDGRLNVMTTVMTQIKKGIISGGPGAPETAWQEDSYTLKGEGVETWSPRFTFHGFQYVEITGWPGIPGLDAVTGLRMNSALEQTGVFASSDSMLNRLHDVIQWTFLSNVFSVQSDCPAREKLGYGADMVVTANSFIYNYDMSHFYAKAVRDFANDQRPKGGMTEIAPSPGINERGYGDSTGPLGWQLAFPYLQQQLYRFYGDKQIIEKFYPAFKRQIAYLRSQADNNLFHWDIGDHEAIDPKAEAFSASCFYLQHVEIIRDFAGILGKTDDSLQYAKLASNVRAAITRQFMIPRTGRFDNGTQAAQIFALWYKLAPDTAKSFETLLNEFKRHDWHISTGIFSTAMLFDVLRERNETELAWKLVKQTDYPGWGYMLKNGATTLWESWEFPELFPSRNHPMFGSVDEWFYRSLLGINAGAPGFQTVIIKPQPPAALKSAAGSFMSVRGKISSSWHKWEETFTLNVTIPGNTSAEIWVPMQQGEAVAIDGVQAEPFSVKDGYAMFKTGSGQYRFEVRRK